MGVSLSEYLTDSGKWDPTVLWNRQIKTVQFYNQIYFQSDDDDDDDEEEDMEEADKSDNKLVTIKSPAVGESKKTTFKKSTKKPVLRRVASSGKIIKRNKMMIRKKFGINKGVQVRILYV